MVVHIWESQEENNVEASKDGGDEASLNSNANDPRKYGVCVTEACARLKEVKHHTQCNDHIARCRSWSA
jgi:hypothetical protein